MQIVWSQEIDSILNVGRQLSGVGLRNWALTQAQALTACETFLKEVIPILGEDVCQNNDGVVTLNYDSWHCEPLPNEDKRFFVRRSIEKAKDYINSYPISDIDKILFALVPGV